MRRGRTTTMISAWLLAAACHEPVHDLGPEPDPLFVLHGRVEGPLPADVVHLRAGLLWTGVPVYVPYCQDHGPTPLDPTRTISEVARKACRDPFGVVPALFASSAPVDPVAQTFAIPIQHLPDASVMVGPLASRVAYASIVIFDDQDGNTAFDLGRCGRGFADNLDGGPPADPEEEIRLHAEPMYAASFSKLTAAQTRLVYVEGPFDATSFFYPHSHCTQMPPPGFSLWRMGNLLGAGGDCTLSALDAEVVLTATAAESLTPLGCLQRRRDSFPSPPPDGEEGDGQGPPTRPGTLWECQGTSIVTAQEGCGCPNIRVFTLKGCFNDLACDTPDWNVPMPPDWPCRR